MGKSRTHLSVVPESPDVALRKPMQRVSRLSLFEKEVRMRVSPTAAGMLLDQAKVLTEGQVTGPHYFGSTMITIDLGAAAHRLREECDPITATLLANLVAGDVDIICQLQSIAIREAEKNCGQKLVHFQIEVHTKPAGSHVHVDIDVEARLQPRLTLCTTRSSRPKM